MQSVEKFVPYLTTDDERKKEVALLVITTLASPEFATQFAKLNPSQGTQAAADRIMAGAAQTSQTTQSVSVVVSVPQPAQQQERPPPVSAAAGTKRGWVYLGHYVASEKRWETRYFDFPVSADPASLVSSSPAVRSQTGNINVRLGMPTDSGAFPAVSEVLKPGVRVKVLSVTEWSYTGYMWAEVDYLP